MATKVKAIILQVDTAKASLTGMTRHQEYLVQFYGPGELEAPDNLLDFPLPMDAWNAKLSEADTTMPVLGAMITTGIGAGLKVTDKDAKAASDKNPLEFIVTVEWSTGSTMEIRPSDATKAWNFTYASRSIITQEPMDQDRTYDEEGVYSPKPCRLPNGNPLNPPLMADIYDEEITIGFNLGCDQIDFDAIENARGSVNTEEMTLTIRGVSRSFHPLTLKLADFTYNFDSQDASVYRVNAVLEYRSDTWVTKRMAKDYYVKDPAHPGEVTPILDGDGNKVVTPWYLNADGTAAIPWNASDSELPDPIEFMKYWNADYSDLFAVIGTIP